MTSRTASRPAQTATARVERVRFVDLLRSEWIKLTSLPSLVFGMLCIAGLGGGLPILIGATLDYSGPTTPNIPESVYAVVGLPASLAITVAGVLGAMVSGSEYVTRTIQTTLLSGPARVPTLMAKAVLVFALTTGVAAVSTFAGWGLSYPLFERFALQIDLGMPGVALALLGGIFSVGFVAACGVGVGAIVRSTTFGTVLMIMLTFGSMLVVQLIPSGIAQHIVGTFALGMAAARMAAIRPESAFLELSTGQVSVPAAWLIIAGWALVALLVGAVLLKRRDA